MGVPKFYRWISERYPCLSETVKEFQIPEFDNLYLDMNGIIHVCSHPEDDNPHFRITEEKIFEDIMHYLEFLFRMIKPRKVFFMAVDGVAPRAKMNQQRGRRFRSAREAEDLEKKAREKGEVLPTEKRFDSNCITPGTPFMVRLQDQLKYFVVNKLATDPLWRGVRVFLSGHETPGEGEHKIMDFIRTERCTEGYDSNTRHCLYGLDADLMMLGLATHEPHFSLLREEVRFGGRKNQSRRPATPEETTFHLLHLSLFREYLDFEFSPLKEIVEFPYDLEAILDDWVMMGFLVGNDFIPHLPNLHINHDALPLLWKTYIEVLPDCGGYINEGGHLNLERFEKYLTALSQFDIDTFSEQYGDLKWLEGKSADKEELLSAARKLSKNIRKSENTFAALEKFEFDMPENEDEDLGVDLQHSVDETPEDSTMSGEESEDTFEDEFRHHKRHYYMTKMEYEKVTPEVLRDQAEGYVRGIQWILLYYYEGVPSWSWFYPHHYAPYMSDVKNFSQLSLTFELGTPFKPFEQLMAVLPAASRETLPKTYQVLMTTDSSPVIDFYPPEFQTDLNGKQQDWEAVVLIPFIDESRLLSAMRSVEALLTDEERSRNKHGPCLLYQYTANPGPVFVSTIPGYFPDIGITHHSLTEIYLEDLRPDLALLTKGLLEGVKLDVFFPGFPTMKHIPHTSELKKEGVKVFQMNSRSFNVMLHITQQESTDDVEMIAKEYLDKEIYVHWPHLYQAKVVSVSDGHVTLTKVDIAKEKSKVNKDVPAKFEVQREELTDNEANIWEKEVANIKETYKMRLGVGVGRTSILLKALPMTGRKYVCGSHGRLTTEKQYGSIPVPFVLQATIKDIKVHDPSLSQFDTIQDYLPEKCPIFMLGWPHYGCQGEVLQVENTDSGRVRISLTIFEEPNIVTVMESQQYNKEKRYFPGYVIAQRLGISSNFLSRITGCIFIARGSPEACSDQRVNLGLNMKFTKRQEELPGYTRLNDGQWLYSDRVTDMVKDYMKSFPEVWTYICKSDKKHNDMFFETEVFPKECSYDLKAMQEYVKSQPSSKVKSVKAGTDIIPEEVITNLQTEADKVVAMNQKKQKRVKLQVKPHLLFRPLPTHGALIPDSTTTYETFDRVINVRQGFPVPFGLRGTVVGIHVAENETNTMYEVLFDEEFQGGISIRSSEKRAYRMPPSGLLNLTHGERKNGVVSRPVQQKHSQTQNSSSGNWRTQRDNTYADVSRGGPNGSYNNQNFNNQFGRNDNRGGYSNGSRGGNSGPTHRRPDQQFVQAGGKQILNREGGTDPRVSSEAQVSSQSGSQSFTGQVFNGTRQTDDGGQTEQPKFVTPKVQHTAPARRMSQEGKDKAKDNSNEFEDIWNQLITSVPDVKPSDKEVHSTTLQQAAAVLPKVPSPGPPSGPVSAPTLTGHSDVSSGSAEGQTKIDVENLFSQASRAQVGDEFSAMFKSLEGSSSGKPVVSAGKGSVSGPGSELLPETDEDGTALIKKMLHLDVAESGSSAEGEVVPPSGTAAPKSYGRQLSIQELFDGVKQQQGKEEKADVNYMQPTSESSQQQQLSPRQPNVGPNQMQPQTWQQQELMQQQQQQQMHPLQQQQQQHPQGRPNVLLPNPPGGRRNPVMELAQFGQTLKLPPPAYDFIHQSGKMISIVMLMNIGRFQGVPCKNKEEAAESAASVALLQMRGSMQQMAMQSMLRLPSGFIPGMIPQGRQFSSPNSAFSPVPNFTGNVQRGPFLNQPNPRAYGGAAFNRGPGQQQQSYPAQQRGGVPQYRQPPAHQSQMNPPQINQSGILSHQGHQSRGGPSESQVSPNNQPVANRNNSATSVAQGGGQINVEWQENSSHLSPQASGQHVQTSIHSNSGLTPFIPLQVARKQTPQKGQKVTESGSAEGSKPSLSETSVNKDVKNNTDSEDVLTYSTDHTYSTSVSQSEQADRTPRKGQGSNSSSNTPIKSEEKRQTATSAGKPKGKRRMAANFNFSNAS